MVEKGGGFRWRGAVGCTQDTRQYNNKDVGRRIPDKIGELTRQSIKVQGERRKKEAEVYFTLRESG